MNEFQAWNEEQMLGPVCYETTGEWAEHLRKWMAVTNRWYDFHREAWLNAQNSAYQQVFGNTPSANGVPPNLPNGFTAFQPRPAQHFANGTQPNGAAHQNQFFAQAFDANQQNRRFRRCRIPGMAPRIVAELIDYALCMFIKLLIHYVLLSFDLVSFDAYEVLYENPDPINLYALAPELLPAEFIAKLLISLLEAVFIAYGCGRIGKGQTPGKYLVGVQVIDAKQTVGVPGSPELVDVKGRPQVKFTRSLLRSFLKNMIVNAFLPLATVTHAFQFDRVIYDFPARTLVVKA
ncbi:unnamed protein product, partial [Mesorhabditis spiculigera]